jgi:hypothetical protein
VIDPRDERALDCAADLLDTGCLTGCGSGVVLVRDPTCECGFTEHEGECRRRQPGEHAGDHATDQQALHHHGPTRSVAGEAE